MEIQYIGEHLLPGILGKLFIWISFASALLAAVAYFLISRKEDELAGRRRLARNLFLVHALSLTAVAVVLYFIIFMHYFEYSYVWQYSSKSLSIYYIISCFWAGQEGSFLIWALAQAYIGVILMYRAGDWENRVMAVVALSQVLVTSMMLGISIFGLKIGGSPFLLLRESYPDLTGTIFLYPDYVSKITDGNGLNPLLENFWMTIHPPVLFIGYALALVPFAYAIASLMKKDYHSWISPVIPWTLLSLTLLGAGILLGGAWAYVSLTFGGFWSWDPVENSSLVPWMTLVASLHFLLIARKQNHAMLSAYLFITLSYVLVLYASFLTRSGVLGDTSAHAFGDNGMTLQLLVYLLIFLTIMTTMIAINVRRFSERKSELLLSREFWMFVGAIIIVLAAFQILLMTSVPVINRLFGTDIAPPLDRVGFYNRWQAPFAMMIAAFIAFSQFLNYSLNSPRDFLRKMIIPAVITIVIVVPIILTGVVRELYLILMTIFAIFAVVASVMNLIFKTSSTVNRGAIITHTGFALFLLGTVLTFSNSRTISVNTSQFDLGSEQANAESLLLMRGDTMYMSGFYVTYVDNRQKGNLTEYRVDFMKRRDATYLKEFSLFPSVNRNLRMGDVYNPATKRFLSKDYYTYIAFASAQPDYIVIRAIVNPNINILWAGAIIMTVGFIISFLRRIRRKRVEIQESAGENPAAG